MDFRHYLQKFGVTKRFYVVVHATDTGQAFAAADTAFKAGADGIFLINHEINARELLHIYDVIRDRYPLSFIGVNLLDCTSHDAFYLVTRRPGINALWVDDSGITDAVRESALELEQQMRASTWSGSYFASTAFKGQDTVYDIETAAILTAARSDVVVTSGITTGSAPRVEKISTMKQAIPKHRLAIASGMTLRNLPDFLPYADDFLIATGVSQSGTDRLDANKIKAVAELIRAYSRQTAPT